MAEEDAGDAKSVSAAETTDGAADTTGGAADTTGSATDPSAEELATLRAENEELRRQKVALEHGNTLGKRVLNVARTTLVVILLVLTAVLATVSVPAIWGRNLVLNTDRYVQTLSPLASDPGVQAGVIKAIDTQFENNVDIKALLADVLPPRAQVLAGPLQSAANSLVNTVATRFVQSPAFTTLWTEINRAAHSQLVAVLTGKNGSQNAISIANDTVVLNLGPIVDQVKQQLVNAGLTVAANVPSVGATIEVAQVSGIESARRYVRWLDNAANWVPILALVCLIAAVVAARRRRRALIVAALSTAAGLVLLALVLAIARHQYLNALPGTYLSTDTAGRIFDTLVRYLRLGLRLVLLAVLLLALGAWLSGPARAARSIRHAVMVFPRKASRELSSSQFGKTLEANRLLVSVAIGAVGALILVLWTNPGLVTVIVVFVVVALLILLIYSLKPTPDSDSDGARPPAASPPAGPQAALTPEG
ncbi:hypothetical protein ACSMXN_08780 [Jatrophihabitans sp. DSM 45814]